MDIYIQSHNNIADMGTRKGVQVKDVDQSSLWRNGYPWMSEEESDIPTITIETLSLMNIKDDVNLEMHKYGQVLDAIELTHGKDYNKNGLSRTYLNISPSRNEVPVTVETRYKFCSYLIDPNKHRSKKIMRIMALVQRFIRNI